MSNASWGIASNLRDTCHRDSHPPISWRSPHGILGSTLMFPQKTTASVSSRGMTSMQRSLRFLTIANSRANLNNLQVTKGVASRTADCFGRCSAPTLPRVSHMPNLNQARDLEFQPSPESGKHSLPKRRERDSKMTCRAQWHESAFAAVGSVKGNLIAAEAVEPTSAIQEVEVSAGRLSGNPVRGLSGGPSRFVARTDFRRK